MKPCRLLKLLMVLALVKLALLAVVGLQFMAPAQGGGRAVVAMAPAQAQEAAPAPAPEAAPAPAEAAQPEAAPAPDAPVPDRQGLVRRQEELDRRERELRALEQKIARDMAALEERRAQLQRMLDDAEMVKDKKDRHLVDVFSNMKAKQAASVMETMDEAQAVKILSGMRGRQAGEILTFVNAEKAARLAEQLTRLQIPFE
ncbi:MotE family protein [Desulfocurvus vexinensis]|uniref:MotE family protein n=1 Tax=Desulfocurvus vexinensis TaxID=399548 RepID=UPI00048ECD0B|nr:hypothetical protein [Desulfocurvus vexinensis]